MKYLNKIHACAGTGDGAGGILRKSQVEEKYVKAWKKKDQIFEKPVGG